MLVPHLKTMHKSLGGWGARQRLQTCWTSLRNRGHWKGRSEFPTSSQPLSHQGLQAWGSRGWSQRNHWVINLISKAGSSGWGRDWDRKPSSLLLAPHLYPAPRPLNPATSTPVTLKSKELKSASSSGFPGEPEFLGSVNCFKMLNIPWVAPARSGSPSFSLLGP